MNIAAVGNDLSDAAVSAGMQRARGSARLSTKTLDGRTRLDRLYQQGCAKIRLPRVVGDGALEAVLINSSGGLTGGDRLDWSLRAGEGNSAVVTTQACEKIYKASHGAAEVSSRVSVGRNARLAWLPQETILFEGSALTRRLEVDVAEGGEVLIVEPVVFGRLAMGERPLHGTFSDRWSIRYADRLVHAEAMQFGPEIGNQTTRPGVFGGGSAMATVLWLHPDAEEHVERVRAVAGPDVGVSGWRVGERKIGKLLARFVAEDGYQLRKRLVPVIEVLNGRAGLPKVWSI